MKRIMFSINDRDLAFPLCFRLLRVGNNKRPYSFIIQFICFELVIGIDEDSYK